MLPVKVLHTPPTSHEHANIVVTITYNRCNNYNLVTHK